jgi:hypothetical protein
MKPMKGLSGNSMELTLYSNLPSTDGASFCKISNAAVEIEM